MKTMHFAIITAFAFVILTPDAPAQNLTSSLPGTSPQAGYGMIPGIQLVLANVQKSPAPRFTAPQNPADQKKKSPSASESMEELGMNDPNRLLKTIAAIVIGVVMSMFMR